MGHREDFLAALQQAATGTPYAVTPTEGGSDVGLEGRGRPVVRPVQQGRTAPRPTCTTCGSPRTAATRSPTTRAPSSGSPASRGSAPRPAARSAGSRSSASRRSGRSTSTASSGTGRRLPLQLGGGPRPRHRRRQPARAEAGARDIGEDRALGRPPHRRRPDRLRHRDRHPRARRRPLKQNVPCGLKRAGAIFVNPGPEDCRCSCRLLPKGSTCSFACRPRSGLPWCAVSPSLVFEILPLTSAQAAITAPFDCVPKFYQVTATNSGAFYEYSAASNSLSRVGTVACADQRHRLQHRRQLHLRRLGHQALPHRQVRQLTTPARTSPALLAASAAVTSTAASWSSRRPTATTGRRSTPRPRPPPRSR